MIQIGASAATIDTPVEHLVACHRRIELRLDTLVRAGESLETDRAAALAAIARSLEFLSSSGALHTEDEEKSVFPRLRAKISAGWIAYLDSLEAQHQAADAIFSALKAVVYEITLREPVPTALIEQYRACAGELRSLYYEHIRSEDEILTDLARKSFSSSEIEEISSEMRARRNRVQGPESMRD